MNMRRSLAVLSLPALTVGGLPWWASLLLGLVAILLAFAAYIYRLSGIFRLASKALDRADPAQTAIIVSAVAGREHALRLPRRTA
ncbi:MAG: hypothetical protein JO345_35985 [Streptosporangiaceae bacterium]|nr:hypothetical protein [Streptosporangiaceae bacterium]